MYTSSLLPLPLVYAASLSLYILSLVAHGARKSHPIELTISSGSIRGEFLTVDAQYFTVFKGIPYAAPPVGGQRFQVSLRPQYRT
ncbi:unnamed protein product [Soboliphyme baturini]|uniref:COesterase domain-containing protein n=1 Tax=Soboliphyme baturini TaxID=241478 RepID=A0A183J2I3_9BILA|nr:unnamed protein product [Soboliphyme baturini]